MTSSKGSVWNELMVQKSGKPPAIYEKPMNKTGGINNLWIDQRDFCTINPINKIGAFTQGFPGAQLELHNKGSTTKTCTKVEVPN